MNSITSINDGLPSATQGLRVIICGAGIGGLTAAIALRRQGHHVEIYEQSRFADEVGAAIHMAPNATGVLKQLGVDPKDAGAVELEQTRLLTAQNEQLQLIKTVDQAHKWQHTWYLAHRAHLHHQLKDAATSKEGDGHPATIHTSSRVLTVDTESAKITLENGTSVSGDVVIGADGVHSKMRQSIQGQKKGPTPVVIRGPHNCFRFLIERDAVLKDPEARSFAETLGSMDMWYTADRKVVLYPTANNKLLNFVCIHPEEMSRASLSNEIGNYSKDASKDLLLEIFHDFHPGVLKMMAMADPATLKIYPLLDMHNLPTYISRRLALLGDAAHPFTPHLAQGGAMAIEDGASLGVFLDRTVTPAEVPERLELYNLARYERASTVQEYSRQVGQDGTADESGHEEHFKVGELMKYALSHDEIHASTQMLRKYKSKQHIHLNRKPTVFGLLPGLLHDANGKSYHQALSQSTKTIASVKFQTSATLLRNLFPNGKFFFEDRATVATVSYSIGLKKNVAWLGGSGYSSLAFYIHGVSYRETDGRVRRGTYCPIIFENLAESIISGREELGISKMFSDIDITENKGSSLLAKVSWRGTTWAEFEWKNLQKDSVEQLQTKSNESDDLLVHKYIPGTGSATPDADYDVLLPMEHKKASVISVQNAMPAGIRFKLTEYGPKELPTLYPVISRLAELPKFEVLEGSVVETSGLTDYSNALRLK